MNVISVHALFEAGWTRPQIEDALAGQRLHRVARGWYAFPYAPSAEVDAIRQGGRVGCLTGCKLHGIWTPDHPTSHTIIPAWRSGSRPEWHRAVGPLPDVATYPLEECLSQVLRHHGVEESLMVLESATNQGRISPSQARLLIAEAPARRRGLKFFDPKAESGSETRVRLFLQRHRFQVQSQVVIEGIGRVDLKVGRSLLIECDSQEFHGDHRVDRRRDVGAAEQGYAKQRLSFEQVHHTWADTQRFLLRLLSTGKHLLPPRPLGWLK